MLEVGDQIFHTVEHFVQGNSPKPYLIPLISASLPLLQVSRLTNFASLEVIVIKVMNMLTVRVFSKPLHVKLIFHAIHPQEKKSPNFDK